MKKPKGMLVLLIMLIVFGGAGNQAALAYSPGEEIPINFPKNILPANTDRVAFTPTGGQVFVSNAPESLHKNGALRPDGSVITGQYNTTLYRDTVTGPFRFWASHYNNTGNTLKFWLHIKNTSDQAIDFFRVIEAYSDAYVTVAASDTTMQFMNAVPNKQKLATIPAHGSFYFKFSDDDDVALEEAMVVFAEYKAEYSIDGSDASILMSHVVTTSDITDPTPYAEADTIARTNATPDRSDDYRGLLDHWGRTGTINIELTPDNPFLGINQADTGYAGEQEKLMTRWDTNGNAVEQREVRFITSTLNKLRLAYWYTDYEVDVQIQNSTGYPVVHTLYGSNGSNPGFVNFQLNGGAAINNHFARNTTVSVTTDNSYHLRMMVMPSASLPHSIYFAGGTTDKVPNEIPVTKAEHTLLESDRQNAAAIVNLLPNGTEKTDLLARLAALALIMETNEAVRSAEDSLNELAALLQANASSAGKRAVPSVIQTAFNESQSLSSEASSKVTNLPTMILPVLENKANELRRKTAVTSGTIQSIDKIMEDWHEPIRKGNGSSKFRYKVTSGSTINLPQLVGKAFTTSFPNGEVRYLSLVPDAVSVDAAGNVTVNKNGVQPLIVYSHEGVKRMFLVASSS